MHIILYIVAQVSTFTKGSCHPQKYHMRHWWINANVTVQTLLEKTNNCTNIGSLFLAKSSSPLWDTLLLKLLLLGAKKYNGAQGKLSPEYHLEHFVSLCSRYRRRQINASHTKLLGSEKEVLIGFLTWKEMVGYHISLVVCTHAHVSWNDRLLDGWVLNVFTDQVYLM